MDILDVHKKISRATFYSKFKFRKNDKTLKSSEDFRPAGIRIKLGKLQVKIRIACTIR